MKTLSRPLAFAAVVLVWGTTVPSATAVPLGHFANSSSGGNAGATGSGGNRDGGHNEGHTDGYNSGIPHPVPSSIPHEDNTTVRRSELDAGGLGHTH
ncbi:MAG: hypothetical protein ACRC20_00825 [Segniliparus sp.]|uniref:hypothetical protein n=1 Tax=Segniliparus sp. TaxID=2804064 RepID=UPI003F302D8D